MQLWRKKTRVTILLSWDIRSKWCQKYVFVCRHNNTINWSTVAKINRFLWVLWREELVNDIWIAVNNEQRHNKTFMFLFTLYFQIPGAVSSVFTSFFFVPVSKQRTINNFCLFHGETRSASALPLLLKWYYFRCPGRSIGTPQRSDLFLKHLLTVSISDNTFYRITSLREPRTHEIFLNFIILYCEKLWSLV